MRTLIALLLAALASSATAWEATTTPICTLTHETDTAHIRLTYDPTKPLYTLAITRKGAAWPDDPWFAIRFVGPRELTISTDKHALSDNGQTLNVADSGFSNVLDGLQFNAMALAGTQSDGEAIDLEGAAPEVQTFRDCTSAQIS
ncbi:hypothetical protein shim_21190 [Shimia sp. SK013]|uniref:hypothetical protein n=1 Tax=Shimia sp. SK013 TaxID=1389006 RepID=UPI0006B5B40A|nr:hypothetical protein [Shimia sp. SK013]KPA21415.1 hypothetical protein shim_21190 [Shimia sp. SK013]